MPETFEDLDRLLEQIQCQSRRNNTVRRRLMLSLCAASLSLSLFCAFILLFADDCIGSSWCVVSAKTCWEYAQEWLEIAPGTLPDRLGDPESL